MSQRPYKHLFLINFPIKHSLWNPLNIIYFALLLCPISDIAHLWKQKSSTSFQLIFNIFYPLSHKRGRGGGHSYIFFVIPHIQAKGSSKWHKYVRLMEILPTYLWENRNFGTFENFSLIFMVFLCLKYIIQTNHIKTLLIIDWINCFIKVTEF